MKKMISLVLTMTLVITSAVSIVAAPQKHERENASVNVKKTIETESSKHLKSSKDKIKEIVDEKKKNNDKSVPIILGGNEVKTEVPPVFKNGRILIPIRAVTTSLGANVTWEDSTKTATVTKAVYTSVYGDTYEVKNIEIKICLADEDDIWVTVNGQKVDLDVEPATINGRIVVPIRFIAETLLNNVEWDEALGVVVIHETDEEDEDDEDNVQNHKDEDDDQDDGDHSPGKHDHNNDINNKWSNDKQQDDD